MTHLELLNSSFISILLNPFSQEAWADFDLSCIYLNKQGFKFKQSDLKSKYAYKTVSFLKKKQYDFIDIELKKAVDLQFFEWSRLLLEYKNNVLTKWWRIKHQKIKIYQMDYFIEKDGVIYFRLCGHPLLDMKFLRILNRRVKISVQ